MVLSYFVLISILASMDSCLSSPYMSMFHVPLIMLVDVVVDGLLHLRAMLSFSMPLWPLCVIQCHLL